MAFAAAARGSAPAQAIARKTTHLLRTVGARAAPSYVESAIMGRYLLHGVSQRVMRMHVALTRSLDGPPALDSRTSSMGLFPLERVAHHIEHLGSAAILAPFVFGAMTALYPEQALPSRTEWQTLGRRFLDLHAQDRALIGPYVPRAVIRPSFGDLRFFYHIGSIHDAMERILTRAMRQETVRGPLEQIAPEFPAYHRELFHWMGWHTYDIGLAWDFLTSMLFFGAYAAIARQAIPPVVDHLHRLQRGAQILEVGGGTGSFLKQLIETLAWHRLPASSTLVDLSPSQLNLAKDRFYRDRRVTLVEGNAETLNAAANTFDIALAQHLVHELPPDARYRVAAELYRVTRPGGELIVIDAAQDGEGLTTALDNFPHYLYEPFFDTYRAEPLVDIFGRVGWTPIEANHPLFLAKRARFRKPASA
jgi:ubiquinone/menaquinone biosynthesis C-methylase UbiE